MTRRADPATTRLPAPRGTIPEFAPVPRKCPRHDGWTAERQRHFIEALADTGSVRAAARAVDMSAEGAYYLRRQDGAQGFRAAWEAALDCGVQRIEDTAMDRALNGVSVPVYAYGRPMGERTVYNDRLLMFMLRNRAPERFAEGKPKGLNAIDRMELARLKKQWRKECRAEWDAERAAEEDPGDEGEVIAEINRKLSAQKQRWEAQLSPRTRAAWEEYERCAEADRTEGYSCYDDPEHALYMDPADCGNGAPAGEEAMPLPPPGWGKREAEDDGEEEIPRVRTVKDDGWD